MATALFEAGSPDVVYLVDLSSYLLRAYHAVAPLSSPSGEPTHAVHGTVTMLERLFRERRPQLLAIAMDSGRATFRRDIFADYKANRPPAPDDLRVQIRRAEEIVRASGFTTFKMDGVEADDLIATVVKRSLEQGLRVVIVGADKDLMQLCTPDVLLWDTLRNKVFGPPEVEERFQVKPEKLGDLLALMGDSSDNIPGVPSVGPKTAAELLAEFQDLDGIFAHLDDVKRKKLKETLAANEEAARLSRRLVALKDDCEIDVSREVLTFGDMSRRDLATLRSIYEELGFTRQLTALDKELSKTGGALASSSGGALAASSDGDESGDSAISDDVRSAAPASGRGGAARRVLAAALPPELVLNEETLARVSGRIEKAKRVALELHTTTPDKHAGPVLGIGLAIDDGSSFYVPLEHRYVGAPVQLAPAVVWKALSSLSSSERELVVQDKKRQLVLASAVDAPELSRALESAKDTLLGSYLLDPERNHSLAELGHRHGVPVVDANAVHKEGRKKRDFDVVQLDEALPYAASRARTILLARDDQESRLDDAGLTRLYDEVELPLASQLAQMERLGVLIDVEKLRSLGGLCDAELSALEKEAHQIAGKQFNVNAPRQLEVLLFDELGLKPIKRTKTSRSTDAATLEALSEEHALPDVILKIRQISKLKGTYIDALPALVRKDTGRVHGAWEQAVAATGRISSTDPNLQNIPIRSELGRKIREAFVAPPGYQLVSADYSQIELRVLAHLSKDVRLVEAFQGDQDVHLRTAMEIFEVPEDQVTREMRAQAKAVNFGVIYGQGESGLSKAVGIPRADAARFIAAYFRRYDGVRAFLDRTLEQARQGEAVQSVLGRRRIVPDIKSGNRARRLAAERIAMNMPIQGSAADILKLAMLALREPVTPGSRMVLTVHDELVFEVPDAEVADALPRIREKMESAYPLDVPLTVSVGAGHDWNSAH